MADAKISSLTELAAQPANGDLLAIVDVSDTTQAPTGTTKKITAQNARAGLALSGDVTASGLTQATNRLLGRSTAATGAVEEIAPSAGLSLVSGVLRTIEVIQVACSDETTALTTGAAKATFRMPFAMTLTAVRASVGTAPTGASLLTIDINESNSSVLSTLITIDASAKTSTTATTPPVISDSALADDAEITIDIDQVGSTIAGAGLKVTLIGYRS